MMTAFRVNPAIFSKHWVGFLIWGIALVILGSIAILDSALATIISVVFLGALILLCGVIVIFDSFYFWRNKGAGFFLHLVMGVLYIAVGGMLIKSPILGSISITLLLGVFYLIIGLFRLFASTSLRSPRWGWTLFNGIISVMIGILILSTWPSSSLFIIGLFIGIDLLFAGWAYIMTALAAKSMA